MILVVTTATNTDQTIAQLYTISFCIGQSHEMSQKEWKREMLNLGGTEGLTSILPGLDNRPSQSISSTDILGNPSIVE